MKTVLRILTLLTCLCSGESMLAQCPAGYTQAQTNWDNLDYYVNNTNPYASYITNVLEQTQKFGMGSNYLTVALSAAIADGEFTTHTGDVSSLYAGADVQYTPTAAGQTITITFNNDVQNLRFSLYDVDASQRINIDAYNNLGVAIAVNSVTTYASSILTVTQTPVLLTGTFITATSTAVANTLNTATATFGITGPVKRVVFTIPTLGSDAVFFLSDLNACVTGSFPTNYQQTTNNFRPFTGPLYNQPSYMLVTPDSDSVYYVDPSTGAARFLFLDSERDFVNSFALDHANRILYYISENISPSASNKKLKKINLNTMAITTVVADITATLGIPTFALGVESAGASFYDGALYLGVEGGRNGTGSSTQPRESIVWRIEFDASLNAVNAYQVYASGDCYVPATNTSNHDWGDFLIKDGVLINFNTARNGTPSTYTNSKYHHYNMMTGQQTLYNNPNTYNYNGQAGQTWNGDLYYVRDTIGRYNEDGTIGATKVKIGIVDGPYTWPGGAGDASEPFRPRCDFGDAPASYDPDAQSPAVHERSNNIRLGATWGGEWDKTSSALANVDADEDAMSFVSIYNPANGSYATQASVFNNSGAPVTLCAWLDMDGNGTFSSTEAMTPMTIPSSPTAQTVWVYIRGGVSPLANGSYTYLRLRVTSSAMTADHAYGYFTDGEVEDFRVPVNSYPLSVQLNQFDAKLSNAHAVDLNWTIYENNDVASYIIERSADKMNWEPLKGLEARNASGSASYTDLDGSPMAGTSYYRLRILGTDGTTKFSEVRRVDNRIDQFTVSLLPNPARSEAYVIVNSNETRKAGTVEVFNAAGNRVHSETVNINTGTNRIALPTEKLASGSYVVRVTMNQTIHSQTLIINK